MAGGKKVLHGEYVLPSGRRLPLGAIASKLRRDKMMRDICEKVWAGRSQGGGCKQVEA